MNGSLAALYGVSHLPPTLLSFCTGAAPPLRSGARTHALFAHNRCCKRKQRKQRTLLFSYQRTQHCWLRACAVFNMFSLHSTSFAFRIALHVPRDAGSRYLGRRQARIARYNAHHRRKNPRL